MLDVKVTRPEFEGYWTNRRRRRARRELIINGDFASSAHWTAAGGWAISSGKATHTPGTDGYLTYDIALVPGRRYRLTYTISGRTAGGAQWDAGGATSVGDGTANGTFTEDIVAGSVDTLFRYYGGVTFDGSVDNVSLHQVP